MARILKRIYSILRFYLNRSLIRPLLPQTWELLAVAFRNIQFHRPKVFWAIRIFKLFLKIQTVYYSKIRIFKPFLKIQTVDYRDRQ